MNVILAFADPAERWANHSREELIAEIERLREGFKGATLVVNQASRTVAFTQLKLSALFLIAQKLRPMLEAELEQGKHSRSAEEWARLQTLADELHAAIKLVSR